MAKAKAVIPGGVNSPVRAFGSVGGDPPFISRAEGAYVYDIDGNRYIDYVGSWGPAIVGHAHPQVVEAVSAAAKRGLSFGAPTEGETVLAQRIIELMPAIEQVRLVSSGTEACMSALRLARAYTKRNTIVKFTGCYHGHADMLLVAAGSGALTLGLPDSPGVPAEAARHTSVINFNDADAVRELFRTRGSEIAAVIVEPIIGNAGFIRPLPGFLELLREQCSQASALLIFDEVMTGFRVGPSGVQGLTGIRPDLVTLGKVIGGGMPLAAYGGRRDIMSLVAPAGPMYQAGTLSGNPVAVAAGLKTLEIISKPHFWEALGSHTARLCRGLSEAARKAKIPFIADCEGGMFGFFFQGGPVRSLVEAKASDISRFKLFFHAMLRRGVYLAPSAFEAGFVSAAHTQQDIDATIERAEATFEELS